MEKLTYTYALVKSLYDQGEDYIDSFWPFTVKVFPEGKPVSPEFIQEALEEKFGLRMPLHVLGTILKRASRKGHIVRKERRYELTEEGIKYLGKFETGKEVERRINALVEDIRLSLSKQNVFLNPDEIHGVLLSFLRRNVEPLMEFFNVPTIPSGISRFELQGYEKHLVEYVKEAEKRKPDNFKTLQDMILGSTISVILNAKEPSEIIEIETRKFKHCQIYLDTNFVFCILDLDHPEFNEPAKELFNMLKEHKFEIKVFSFTVDEICAFINRYPSEASRYPLTIKVEGLYSSLKRKGWTKTDTKEFIMKVEGILPQKGITIEWESGVNLKNYIPRNEELRNLIRKYKPEQGLFGQNHDLAAIDKITELRRRSVRKIEDSKAFFLTSDAKLSKFNLLEMGHKENGTICEAILDRSLTNILWLKKPGASVSLKSIVAAHSRGLFIKKRVWDRFCEALKQLKQRGEVEDEKISTLFYHNYAEDLLREFDETEVDEITPEFILQKIEESSKLAEEREQGRIKEREKEFLRRLKKKVAKREQEKDKEWLEKLEVMKENIRKLAQESAKKRTWGVRISFMVLLSIPIIICAATRNWDMFRSIEGILPAISLILGLTGGLRLLEKLWRKIQSRWFNTIFTKKIREVGLGGFQ